ncbi:MAG: DUF2232 domain-containing protein [Candidatus Tectomicrobia bacterium]|nr:DUF2232 domain-containing protein [Candidatus Tectomicrobia bacterium]
MDGRGAVGQVRAILGTAAGSFMLFLAPGVLPLLGDLLALFTPTPLVLAGLRFGWRVAAIAGLLSMGGVTLLLGSSIALLFAAQYVVAAVAMSEALQRRAPTNLVVGGSVAAVVLAGALLLGVAQVVSEEPPLAALTSNIEATFEATLEAYRKVGQNDAQLAAMRTMAARLGRSLRLMVPGLLVSLALAGVTANLLMVRRILPRWGGAGIPRDPDLGLWSAPWPSLLVGLASGAALLLPVRLLRVGAANVLLVLALLFFLHGLAVAHFYLARSRLPGALRAAGYGVLLMAPLVLAAVGVFDCWFNVRRLPRPPALPGG